MGPINAASVLLLVRDGKAADLDSLTAILATDRPPVYARYDVHNALKELKEAGLVELGPSKDSGNSEFGIANLPLRLAPNWHLVQRSLGFSLTKLAAKRDDSLQVNP